MASSNPVLSMIEAVCEFIDVATHPIEANRVAPPRDRQAAAKQGVLGPTVFGMSEEQLKEASRRYYDKVWRRE